MRMKSYSWLLLSFTLGCVGGDAGPDAVDSMSPGLGGTLSEDLFFLTPNPGSILEYSASFWAVKGQSRTLTMSYAPTEDGQPGAPLLTFEVGSNSLMIKPSGGAFQHGDSVLITVQLDRSEEHTSELQSQSNLVCRLLLEKKKKKKK